MNYDLNLNIMETETFNLDEYDVLGTAVFVLMNVLPVFLRL